MTFKHPLKTPQSRWRSGAVVALLGLSLAGCGGGGGGTSSSTATTPTVTKAAFLAKASAACDRADRRKAKALAEATGGNPNFSEAEGKKLILTVVLPIYGELTDELATLATPPEQQAAIERLLAGYRAGIRRSEKDPTSALDGKAFFNVDEMAVRLGLRSCIY